MKTRKKITQYPDGSIRVQVEDNRTLKEKLSGLSFADRLELMYPTNTTEAEITKGWAEFDDHKLLK
jgi:hypothetical protein